MLCDTSCERTIEDTCTNVGSEREMEGDCNERACNTRGVYLHAKVHFIQVYNYGFPSRQVPVPEDSRLGSGFRNALATFLPTFSSFQPHQPVQPFGRVRFPSPSLHLITLRPTEYTPSYETLYVEHAIDG